MATAIALTACTGSEPAAQRPTTATTTTAEPSGSIETTPHVPTPATGLLALRPGDVDAADPTEYSVVILNAWEAHRIPAIKARSPQTTVLVYKDMASTRSYAATEDNVDDELLPAGIGYGFARQHHPDWFLRDQRGKNVEWRGYDGHWWMDVGNPEYQDTWITNVLGELTQAKWDGLYVDNAMYTPDFYLPSGRRLAKYPDDDAYSRATEAFLTKAAAATQQAGKQFVANFGARFPDTDLYARWAALGTGVMREHFGRFGTDGHGQILTGEAWTHQLAQQETAQRLGKTFLAISYALTDDVAFQQYARASFLLGWDGNPQSALFYTPAKAKENPWTPTWTADIGTPTGAKEPAGPSGGAWRRPFTGGVVIVNPSPTNTEIVDGVALAPGTGAIIL